MIRTQFDKYLRWTDEARFLTSELVLWRGRQVPWPRKNTSLTPYHFSSVQDFKEGHLLAFRWDPQFQNERQIICSPPYRDILASNHFTIFEFFSNVLMKFPGGDGGSKEGEGLLPGMSGQQLCSFFLLPISQHHLYFPPPSSSFFLVSQHHLYFSPFFLPIGIKASPLMRAVHYWLFMKLEHETSILCLSQKRAVILMMILSFLHIFAYQRLLS